MSDHLLFKRMFSTGWHRQYIELQGDYWKRICAPRLPKLCQFQSRHTLRKNINFIFAFKDALALPEKNFNLLTQLLLDHIVNYQHSLVSALIVIGTHLIAIVASGLFTVLDAVPEGKNILFQREQNGQKIYELHSHKAS